MNIVNVHVTFVVTDLFSFFKSGILVSRFNATGELFSCSPAGCKKLLSESYLA